MSTHKHFDKICAVIVVLSLIITVVFMNGEKLGITVTAKAMGYESRLFDEAKVHTIDIVMDDWDSFIETCENEEYSVCNVVIDGEAYKNVGIRAKGNTSLSTVSSLGSDRYSFKIEFDQYNDNLSYYGLDKLCLNNIIQDNTYMKDFLVYQLMEDFGVAAPLCSFVYITVNGEDWGLYLAVEGIEDAFLQRNYGSDYGELYKPDSLSFGGGRGNGKDFDMGDFDFSEIKEQMEESGMSWGSFSEETETPDMSAGFDPSSMGGMFQKPGSSEKEDTETADDTNKGSLSGGKMDFGGMGNMFGGIGNSDVKLQYSDDNYDSYSNIFDSAKTDITDTDRDRLIESLKSLSNYENLEEVVDMDAVLRYFVIHNFVVNGDSYTGSMIHNYYLYEEDRQLSMIPWDYNLAYGTFQGSDATGTINTPIDTPVSGGTGEDRPMVGWIFENEEYTEAYHEYFAEFINKYFDSGYIESFIDYAAELIAPYVEKDPTKFCTYEEFETGVETIKEFCLLRAESVSGQLEGTIASTSTGQSADDSTLVDASAITLSAMGTMGGGMGGGMMMPNRADRTDSLTSSDTSGSTWGDISSFSGGMTFPGGMELPEGMQQMPDGMQMPDMSGSSGTFPDMGNMQGMMPWGEQSMPGTFGDVSGGEQSADDSSVNSDGQQGENSQQQSQRPSRDNMSFGTFPTGKGEGMSQQSGFGEWIVFGVTLVVLAAGLIFAFKFKR